MTDESASEEGVVSEVSLFGILPSFEEISHPKFRHGFSWLALRRLLVSGPGRFSAGVSFFILLVSSKLSFGSRRNSVRLLLILL